MARLPGAWRVCGASSSGAKSSTATAAATAFASGLELRRFGVVDQSLRARLADVADARLAHAVAHGLARDLELEGALEPRDAARRRSPWKISTVRRSRAADGSSRMLAQASRQAVGRAAAARPERQDAGSAAATPPAGSGSWRRSRRSASRWWRSPPPCTMRPAAGRPSCRPSSSQRLSTADEQKQLGQDVAEARRDHLPALEPAAERQQRDIDGERERRGVAAELAVELASPRRRPARARTCRRSSARPQARNALAKLWPTCAQNALSNCVEPARAVLVLERQPSP